MRLLPGSEVPTTSWRVLACFGALATIAACSAGPIEEASPTSQPDSANAAATTDEICKILFTPSGGPIESSTQYASEASTTAGFRDEGDISLLVSSFEGVTAKAVGQINLDTRVVLETLRQLEGLGGSERSDRIDFSPFKTAVSSISLACGATIDTSVVLDGAVPATSGSTAPSTPMPVRSSAATSTPAAPVELPAPGPSVPETFPGEGDFEVGVDMIPGTYKTKGPIRAGVPCRTLTASDPAFEEDPDFEFGDGQQIIVLKAGQFIRTSSCLPWRLYGK